MNRSLALLALVAVLFLVQPHPSEAATVCKGAAVNSAVPGGWTLIPPKTANDNDALEADADKLADDLLTGKYAKCTVKNVKILKACSQVVAGIQYQYSAKVTLKCGKKTVNKTITNTFVEAPTGK